MKPVTKQVIQIDHIATGRMMRDSRLQRSISLRSVAKRMKVSAAYLSDLELGKRNWTVEKVLQYEKAL